jgi:hypothetical protein
MRPIAPLAPLVRFTALLVLVASAAGAALAHGDEASADLHVGYAYDSCYIDLHPELSTADFRQFSREFADAGAFLPLAGATSLGRGHVTFGLSLNQTFLDDTTPQWNETFTHPGEDHYLGQPGLPVLQTRVGLSERVDGELMVTGDPQSNWAIAGLGARRLLVLESERAPVSLSARGTWTHLLGADELNHDSATMELLASRRFGRFTPFAGAGLTGSLATEEADDVSLDRALSVGARGALGAELAVGPLRLSGQAMLASVPSVALMVGGAI